MKIVSLLDPLPRPPTPPPTLAVSASPTLPTDLLRRLGLAPTTAAFGAAARPARAGSPTPRPLNG